jgi:DNA-binding response OmpR family regulator
VLIVEDDESLREAFTAVFEDEGWQVTSAPDLASARRALETQRPGLVVLDLTLDGEFGGDFLAELAGAEKAPVTLVVSALPNAKEIAARYGVDALAKPFDLDELFARVAASVIGGRRPRQL